MKALITDYDNTYDLHYTDLNVDDIFYRNKKAIDSFMKKGLVAIATGRHFDAIKKTIEEKKLSFDYLCCNNGAEVYDHNYQSLFVLPLSLKDLNIIKELDKKIKIYYRENYDKNHIISVNIYCETKKLYKELEDYLCLNLKESLIEFKYPKIKIINSKCNKIIVADIISKRENIDRKDIYTIGDDLNDMELIKRYNGYSLSRANKDVKEQAIGIVDELNHLVSKL